MTAQRFMLIDGFGKVLAEVTSSSILAVIHECTILQWRGWNFVYSRDHRNGEYEFYQLVGKITSFTDAAVRIVDESLKL